MPLIRWRPILSWRTVSIFYATPASYKVYTTIEGHLYDLQIPILISSLGFRDWDGLPQNIIELPTVEQFKVAIDAL